MSGVEVGVLLFFALEAGRNNNTMIYWRFAGPRMGARSLKTPILTFLGNFDTVLLAQSSEQAAALPPGSHLEFNGSIISKGVPIMLCFQGECSPLSKPIPVKGPGY